MIGPGTGIAACLFLAERDAKRSVTGKKKLVVLVKSILFRLPSIKLKFHKIG